MRLKLLLSLSFALCSCSDAMTEEDGASPTELELSDFHEDLSEIYRNKPSRWSKPVALIKHGMTGRDWLLTVHGLADNLSACEEMAAPYNDDPDLSVLPGTYRCEEIDERFAYGSSEQG